MRLSVREARRIALAAQGFSGRRPGNGPRSIARIVDQLQLLQLDSVNVLTRSHYLPVFSRLGPYQLADLDRASWRAPRSLVEYWGHAACLMSVDLHPFLRWRMAEAQSDAWGGVRRLAAERPDFVKQVLAGVREHGPVTAGQLEEALEHEVKRPSGPWWDWRDTKVALEWLFWSGEVSTAFRRGFERHYDLTERVIPPAVLGVATPSRADAHVELIRRAAKALGVGTIADLRDYFRLGDGASKPAVAELVAAGELLPVTVEGWRQPAYLHKEARVPARVAASALLSPFDSLVWHRQRVERLWDFHYRLEFYTPQPKRIHGYYVLPFLAGERLRARVDVKADRRGKALMVPAAYLESGQRVDDVVEPMAISLRSLASWLGLEDIQVGDRGDLARPLRTYVTTR